MTDQPKSRLKRSRSLTLTSLMAGAAVSVSACDDTPAATQWGDPPAAEARTFANLDECKASGDFTAQQCETTLAEAQKDSAETAPRFANQQSCEERYGVDQCVPRSSQGGGSFFTPLLTGFIIGQALNNMGGYRGAPMYRDRDGTYYGGGGYSLSRDYVTGRPRARAESFDAPARAGAPSRVQSRSFVISRGGFGGGHSFGG
ncbi:DUF1190 domain-containing protein [Phenylobacterium aquaticum]|uniref:DUF1190 domain-containing protein n=1 Tax=Phenylobacterium aquaticum TaxID=1763816 RepID=UPI0026F3699A|nr:DUF1190 domain-containing protein [Phenylobacterium aquaticum]